MPSASRATPTPLPSPAEPTPSLSPGEPPRLKLTRIANGLDRPLFLAAAPGDAERLYVVEQSGRIRIFTSGGVLDTPFLDLSGVVSCCGERGLLGLAFHPGYAANGRFYVNYTDAAGDTVVAEYARSGGDPGVANPIATRVFFTVDQPFANHNGGMLAFGPDGYLYIGLGDGGSRGDPRNNAQNLNVKLGKILRIDADRYPEPAAGNLEGGDPDVWDFGLRNPWRFSFDAATGDLYIADVGQDLYEEVDVEPRGQGGRNYGWRIAEGFHCFDPPEGCDTVGLTPPATEYGRDLGCSVTGGYVYRGRAIPGLSGRYLYADYCSARVWSFLWSGGEATQAIDHTDDIDPDGELTSPTSFGEDQDHELYLTSEEGAVFRIDPE